MNVTPLIDVLLVLIIIFMVIVAESKEKGLEAQIPKPPAHPDATPPPAANDRDSTGGNETRRDAGFEDQRATRKLERP
jgi:biopolymer transport protein ExbD